jgi:hypothetical protein
VTVAADVGGSGAGLPRAEPDEEVAVQLDPLLDGHHPPQLLDKLERARMQVLRAAR